MKVHIVIFTNVLFKRYYKGSTKLFLKEGE